MIRSLRYLLSGFAVLSLLLSCKGGDEGTLVLRSDEIVLSDADMKRLGVRKALRGEESFEVAFALRLAKSVPFKPSNDTLGRDLALSRNTIPDYISYLEASGLFNALREPGHSDNLLSKAEKLYLGNSNIAYSLSEDGRIDDGNMRETNFLAWTRQVCTPTSPKKSAFFTKNVNTALFLLSPGRL